MPKFPADKLICSGGKPLPSNVEPISLSPFLCIPMFRSRSDSPFILVWGSRGKFPHHSLIFDRPGFAHQPYTSDSGKVLFQMSSFSGFFRNDWYCRPKREWRFHSRRGHHLSLFTLLLLNQSFGTSLTNPDHTARILTFLSLTQSYL